MFDQISLEEALRTLGQLLVDRGLAFEIVAIGGGGLLLLGMSDRPTKDLDVVALIESGKLEPAKPLPSELEQAASEVGELLGLARDWLNGGPTSLLRFPGLPDGFIDRAQHRSYGGLHLHVASRFDQIHFKVFAAVDDKPGGKHHLDLQRLRPSRDELLAGAAWARGHDPSEGFALILAQVLSSFGVEA